MELCGEFGMCEWVTTLGLVEGEEVDGMGRGAALVKTSIGGTLEVACFRPTMLVIFG